MSGTARVWLITGAASGFGKSMTQRVLDNGEIAVATDLKPESLFQLQAKYTAQRLLVLKLDVTKQQEIVDAFAAAREAFGRIDVVFNNAGYTVIGELEGTPIEAGRRLLEVNFWGATQVSLEAVRFFRDDNPPGKGGRLLVTTSMVGIGGVPTMGYYAASKHALEGLSETLVNELDPAWNIKITLVEPGGFQTGIAVDGTMLCPVHPAYKENSVTNAFRDEYAAGKITAGDPGKAIREVYEISRLPDPPFRLPLGKDAIAHVKEKIARLAADVERAESRSDDLKFN